MIKGWKKLTKKDLNHLKEMNCNHTERFQETINHQEKIRIKDNRNSVLEPCWECRMIAKKLGMTPEVTVEEK